MKNDQGARGRFGSSIDVAQSDIRPIVRAELETLLRVTNRAANSTGDRLSRIHLRDLSERIDLILNPV